MKASHLVTPRTSAECQFIPSCDPIERPEGKPFTAGQGIVFLVVAVVLAGIALQGVPL
jgi:hypothetical protein